jgi:NAD(P)-dependent dehydrogenase (short-subunit alcohol dehydrogenase family)
METTLTGSDWFSLKGKRILVTGASSGIGRETAVLLSELGADLALVGRDEGRLRETASLLRGGGSEVLTFDFARTDLIPDWMRQNAVKSGKFMGLAHCAGVQLIQPLRFLSVEETNKLLNINVTSCVALARGFRQKDVSCAPASIVLVASVLGLVGAVGRSAYAASKGAIIALGRSLSLELARDGIRVNCVSPGYVHTAMLESAERAVGPEAVKGMEAMHPLGFGEPRDVACAIAFLLAESGRWITGSNLVVDGGYTAA